MLSTTAASKSDPPTFLVGGVQQRSLSKQFESMDMKPNENIQKANSFVVNTLTTANQRASSKSSIGSCNSFAQKFTSTAKANI